MTSMLTVLAAGGMLLLAGCDEFPKDAAGSLDRARSGAPLRAGWSAAPPWVTAGETEADGPAGIEPDLLRAWAAAEGLRLEWVGGSPDQLVRALQQNTLDIAAAGLLQSHPWGARIGNTQPYLTAEIAIGIAAGMHAPEDWDGVDVRYDRRRPQIGAAIRALGAEPVPTAPGDSLAPLGAAYAAELPTFGLSPVKTLRTEPHVIATAAAENALTYSLDRFLLVRKAETRERLSGGAPQ